VADEPTIRRRQHDRYAVTFPVSFSGKAAGPGASNGSLGARLRHRRRPIGSDPSLSQVGIVVAGWHAPLEIELTVVRWSHGQQFGMEFIAFGDAQNKRLLRFLGRRAEAERAQKGVQAA